jgi:hypothetical protein
LVEAMIGHKLDRHSTSSARIISDVLQTDYDELFDLKVSKGFSTMFSSKLFCQGRLVFVS